MSTIGSTANNTTTDQNEPLVVISTVEVVAQLEVLLSQSTLSETEDADVVQLLKHLDNAGDIAEDLEQKLDGMLAKLDDILKSMDTGVEGGEELAPIPDSADDDEK